ncbi:uncharacterized protein LOC129950431 [Eupeodes corollae]|uniref:uncharacterized protein LOC129950431 n=1 Tax=Eupeodes corollae TaxID=290404 RepID=UPI002491CC67|nr:uncharacterized protein LOC129950431 [Eupeodes corollae]
MPITPKMLRYQAAVFSSSNNIPKSLSTSENGAGRKWLRLFMKRHPEISVRKAQMMNPARAQKLNRHIVSDHLKKVRTLMQRISLHHQQNLLAQKGSKRIHQISNKHAENVTIVGCVSAIRTAIPPVILFKGKRRKPEFMDNLPTGSLVKMTPKGYMNHATFVEFISHLGKFKTPGPFLLIFDGAACHLDYSIEEEAERHQITLYYLPSNTTHELQPLDKAVYRSFEHHWDQELLSFTAKYPGRKLNKTSFIVILSNVWSKCMTYDNITSGFRATGLYPFDPDVISEIAFASSALSEKPWPDSADNKNINGSTVTPVES